MTKISAQSNAAAEEVGSGPALSKAGGGAAASRNVVNCPAPLTLCNWHWCPCFVEAFPIPRARAMLCFRGKLASYRAGMQVLAAGNVSPRRELHAFCKSICIMEIATSGLESAGELSISVQPVPLRNQFTLRAP